MRADALPLEQFAQRRVIDAGEVEASAVGLLPFRPHGEAAARRARALDGLQPAAPLPARAQGDALAVQGQVGRVVIDVDEFARGELFRLQQERMAQEGAVRRGRQRQLDFDFFLHETGIIAHPGHW